MRFGSGHRPKDDGSATMAQRVRLGDISDHDRPMTSLVERPPEYTALDHAAATRPVDREAVISEVRDWVREALAAAALDDEVSDFLDARLDAMRRGWDAAVEVERRHRRSTLRSLFGMQMHDVTLTQAKVAELRRSAAALAANVEGWRRVLLGADEFVARTAAVEDAPTAPRAVGLDTALTGSASLHEDRALEDLTLFDPTLDLSYFPQENLR